MSFYFYDETTLEKIQSLPQGFFLSYDIEKKVVISIKSNAGLITSLVKGCQFYLEINKLNPLITLTILDHPVRPFNMMGSDFSTNHHDFINFESVVIDLIKSTIVKVIFLNDVNYQIINVDLEKHNNFEAFQKWLSSKEEKFIVEIKNRDLSDEKKLIYIDQAQNKVWDQNLINDKPYFNFNEYIKDGKHGYNQEFSVRNILSQYYEPNNELFFSVIKKNGEELTDFLILFKGAALIIESKYTLSSKQNKFNQAMVKAVSQLKLAEQIIYDESNLIDNELVQEKLKELQVSLKICIFYDDGRLLEKAFNEVKRKYNNDELPIYISVSVVAPFMAYLQLLNPENCKLNFINNLLRMKDIYKDKDIIVIDGFDINTGAMSFIN